MIFFLAGCKTATTSVGYCDRECQLAHWPTHKKTCKMFRHIVKILKNSEDKFKTTVRRGDHLEPNMPRRVDEMYQDFLALGAHAFCISLILQGIPAEVTYCLPVILDNPLEAMDVLPVPIVISEDSLYDISAPVYHTLYDHRVHSRKIEQIASPEGEKQKYLQAWGFLNQFYEMDRCCPWSLPVSIDGSEKEAIVKWQCRRLIQLQCMTSPHDLVLSLYNDKVIASISGQSREAFSEYMGELVAKQADAFVREARAGKYETQKYVTDVGGNELIKLWKEFDLKPATRLRCPPTDVFHNTPAMGDSLKQLAHHGFIIKK